MGYMIPPCWSFVSGIELKTIRLCEQTGHPNVVASKLRRVRSRMPQHAWQGVTSIGKRLGLRTQFAQPRTDARTYSFKSPELLANRGVRARSGRRSYAVGNTCNIRNCGSWYVPPKTINTERPSVAVMDANERGGARWGYASEGASDPVPKENEAPGPWGVLMRGVAKLILANSASSSATPHG